MGNNEFHLPKATLAFLKGLQNNNNREWFDEHRNDYKVSFVEPLKDLVVHLGEALEKKLPGLRYEPRINGSIFRLNRDVRFSKNKSPYKTNGGVFLWVGNEKKLACPGVYFHLEARSLMLGAGVYMFAPDKLDIYRSRVEENGAALARALKKAEKAGFETGGEKLKRVPRGFDQESKYADLLKYKGLHTGKRYPAKKVTEPGLVKWLAREYAPTFDLVKVLEKSLF